MPKESRKKSRPRSFRIPKGSIIGPLLWLWPEMTLKSSFVDSNGLHINKKHSLCTVEDLQFGSRVFSTGNFCIALLLQPEERLTADMGAWWHRRLGSISCCDLITASVKPVNRNEPTTKLRHWIRFLGISANQKWQPFTKLMWNLKILITDKFSPLSRIPNHQQRDRYRVFRGFSSRDYPRAE